MSKTVKAIIAVILVTLLGLVVKAQAQEKVDLTSRWTYGMIAPLISMEKDQATGLWESKSFDKAGVEWGIDLVDSGDNAWVSVTNPHAFRLDEFAYYTGLMVYFGRGIFPGGSGVGAGVLYPLADLKAQLVGFEAGADDLVWVFVSLGFEFGVD